MAVVGGAPSSAEPFPRVALTVFIGGPTVEGHAVVVRAVFRADGGYDKPGSGAEGGCSASS
ncbi:hypothetical protein [Actinopolyspora halophila]|uniref:hypothetical protein n=1 Tax=Actinopolyspora halophila TaxID=1850 RepID=UPI00036D455E|nr:hypothetical protein [Actinopolyspora halophila]